MLETPFIDIHTHHSIRIDNVLSIINCFPEQIKLEEHTDKYISVGIHPWHLNNDSADENLNLIRTFALLDKVLAIGEIGLDRNRTIALSIQEAYFTKQIAIAESVNKPIIIHCVRYFQELISIKKKLKASTPWLIHGFRNNIQIVEDLLQQNCYISFGEALLFDKMTQDVFIEVPIKRLFLETDESTYSISDIYKKAAQLKSLQLNDFKTKLFENYTAVFHAK
ncbi:TatD family deoxyribonuclease [Ancylomarina euxinus]|uniref:TatD family deoxyribonuclease n=1 Tax=Ancylomarina euxinus TaxID=2283627 RepID=A0A425Y4C5_9BACT|nr:TatD family hydrolase [Ancylomarina euxinus]MCZ4694650.1 TatD family hydrolase [Ancylomarina euxinus]MUP14195.1 TatD family deoxyribonuclease [Ancylomarina euxinus]RRG23047.1 TatD family deoxyribonuclease [Ancylomarina euxinus]